MATRSLLDFLAELTDPRDRRGRLYPVVPLLTLCVVALLAGHTSVAAIAQFGRLRGKRLGHALGFTRGRMPCANTLTNLLAALDADHLDRLLGDWLQERHAAGWDQVALDGKTLRGSRDGPVPGVHLLAAYVPQVAAVIAQMRVEATTNEHKAALRLLGVLPSLVGTVVTADAMFTHADVGKAILAQGGDYLLYAKNNQTQLHTDVATTFHTAEAGGFSPQQQAAWQADVQSTTRDGKGHGRRERRTLTTSTWLNAYLTAWPQVRQVFRWVRQRTVQGKTTVEVVYGITSLGRREADAERWLGLSRAHWGIENGLHYTRDETFREDRCRVRRGEAARVLASLRNVAVYLLRPLARPSVAAATREMLAHPDRALALLNALPSTSE